MKWKSDILEQFKGDIYTSKQVLLGLGSSDLKMGGGNSAPHPDTHVQGSSTELEVKELIMINDSSGVVLWKRRFGSSPSEVSAPLTKLQDMKDAFPTHLYERALVNLARGTEIL